MAHHERRPVVSRRTLLTALAIGGGLAYIPALGWDRKVHAGPLPGARASRVLILNAYGGIRSSAAFYASSKIKYNPYGLIGGTLPFPMGSLLDDYIPAFGESPLPDSAYHLPGSWNQLAVPRLRDLAAQGGFSVVGTWDPGRGDHQLDQRMSSTGSRVVGDGILPRIYGALSTARVQTDAPAFHINSLTPFGAVSTLTAYEPIVFNDPQSLPTPDNSPVNRKDVLARTGHGWAKDSASRGRFDRAVAERRSGPDGDQANAFARNRASAFSVGPALGDWVNVANEGKRTAANGTVDVSTDLSGRMVPLTNQMLYDVFIQALGSQPASHPSLATAIELAIAVRLFQLGSRAVVVELSSAQRSSGFDSHSAEREAFRPVYSALGRFWSTIHFVLSRIPDPLVPGKSLLDTTLVCTTSEFGRDPGSDSTGFNAGGGSDHGLDPSCYYLAHACMGAGIRGGRVLSKVSTDDFRADKIDERYDQIQFIGMILSALGFDAANPAYGFEGMSDPIRALFT